jgi:phosphinothricin acetyltransferase
MAGVRVANEEDAPAVADIYAPYVRDTVISFEQDPPSAEEMRGRMRKILTTYPFLVFEDGGAVVAYAYASPHAERPAYRWSVDVAVYAAPEVHRRGVGRTLYTRLFEILVRQGFHSAFAGITLPNEKSVGLHEAMGFRPVGTYVEAGFKFGAWRDVGWWGRSIGSGLPDGDPTPFAELAGGLAPTENAEVRDGSRAAICDPCMRALRRFRSLAVPSSEETGP